MFCHYRRSAPATKLRDKMCLWSTAGTPNSSGQAPPDTRLGPRSQSTLNPPPLHDFSAAPAGLANASRPHSKLRARSPLSEMTVSCENAALVPAFARNRPPFTRVHSHADAQKSSRAFFHDMDRERCRKRPGRVRIALRGSQEVRASSLMLNQSGWQSQPAKKNETIRAHLAVHVILVSSTPGLL